MVDDLQSKPTLSAELNHENERLERRTFGEPTTQSNEVRHENHEGRLALRLVSMGFFPIQGRAQPWKWQMEDKSKETKQYLEPWTPATETVEAYQDLEIEIVKEGGPISKIMVYTRRYPSILIFWAFLTLVALAMCGIKDVLVYKGVLILGSVGFFGSTLRRRSDDKQK